MLTPAARSSVRSAVSVLRDAIARLNDVESAKDPDFELTEATNHANFAVEYIYQAKEALAAGSNGESASP